MVAVPAATPVNRPVAELMLATVPSFELQVPPVISSLSNEESPAHTVLTPVIASGNGLTVIVFVMRQPVAASW